MHFLLFYDYVADYPDRREQYRAEHLALAWRSHQRGELELAGAYADTPDGAVLWFTGEEAAVAERFAAADPYVQNGLVSRWWVRPWATVVGERAVSPIRPERR